MVNPSALHDDEVLGRICCLKWLIRWTKKSVTCKERVRTYESSNIRNIVENSDFFVIKRFLSGLEISRSLSFKIA